MITHELRVIADAILDKKGQNVISLDLREAGSSITDFFVICNGDSTTNVAAMADNIIFKVREELGWKPLRTMAWVVETNEKGVVITSAPGGSRRAARAPSRARCPLANRTVPGASR